MSLLLHRAGLLGQRGLPPPAPEVVVPSFMAWKATGTGAINATITDYEQEFHDRLGEFDPVAGTYTPAADGYAFIGLSAAPHLGSGSWTVLLQQALANVGYFQGHSRISNTNIYHGAYACGLKQVAAGESYTVKQGNALGNVAFFFAHGVDAASMFAATRSASSGVSGGIIGGYDVVEVNVGADFDAASGIFTAPEAGYYLFAMLAYVNEQETSAELELNIDGADTGVRGYITYAGQHAQNTLGHSVILYLTAGQQVAYRQHGMLPAWGRFSGFLLSPTVAFSARSTTAAAANSVVGSFDTADSIFRNLGGGFDAATGTFTVPAGEGGLYYFGGQGLVTTNASQYLSLQVNGATKIQTPQFHGTITTRLGAVLDLVDVDAVRLYTQAAGVSEPYFGGVRLAA